MKMNIIRFVGIVIAAVTIGCSGGSESEDNAAQVKKMSEKQAPSNNPDVPAVDAKNGDFGGNSGGGKKIGGM
jgi:hypothetical protein